MVTTTKNESSDDVLWGAAAIARYIKRSKRQVYFLIQQKRIPVKKIGPKTIVASKSGIDAALKGGGAAL
jgi:hypothetical protein